MCRGGVVEIRDDADGLDLFSEIAGVVTRDRLTLICGSMSRCEFQLHPFHDSTLNGKLIKFCLYPFRTLQM